MDRLTIIAARLGDARWRADSARRRNLPKLAADWDAIAEGYRTLFLGELTRGSK